MIMMMEWWVMTSQETKLKRVLTAASCESNWRKNREKRGREKKPSEAGAAATGKRSRALVSK
jgi:hypothetical protein